MHTQRIASRLHSVARTIGMRARPVGGATGVAIIEVYEMPQ